LIEKSALAKQPAWRGLDEKRAKGGGDGIENVIEIGTIFSERKRKKL